ncbi:elongation factor 1-beta [Candidatus Woesearchaeota archaeon]|nr:elongation factor 1-beta [Candidatus Woesearchaeota archaeon]
MAKIIVTFKIMPEGPDVDLTKISEQAKEKIASFVGGDYDPESDLKISIVDVAFGLKALDIKAILDEEKGGTEKLEKEFKDLDGVKSVEVIDVRRIIG